MESRSNSMNLIVEEIFADEGHDEEDDHVDEPSTPEDHHDEEVVDDHAHETEQIKPLVSLVWWLLLAVSSILITLLSFGIYKFIHVKK